MRMFPSNLFDIFRTPPRDYLFDNGVLRENERLRRELNKEREENYHRKGYIKSRLWEYNRATKKETNE